MEVRTNHHHNQHRHYGGGSGGNAIASGLGGFAIGAIVGDLIGRNARDGRVDNHSRMPMFGNNQYVNGGYDIIGDSGESGGGYDIQGDS